MKMENLEPAKTSIQVIERMVALLDVLAGRAKPEGKLPFELPSSMDAVVAQKSDMPHDSARPLYPLGFGRRY